MRSASLHHSLDISTLLADNRQRRIATTTTSTINSKTNFLNYLILVFITLLRFSCQGLTRYEDLLAVAVDGSIIVYFVHNLNGTFTLEKKYQKDLTNEEDADLPLLEFKLVSTNVILYCNKNLCRVCKFGEGVTNGCINYPLEGINPKLLTLKATITSNNRLIVRTVAGRGTAAIYALDAGMSKPTNLMIDPAGVLDNVVVDAFATDQHTYFVGSATKVDIPFSLISGDKTRRFRTDIRMSRVCNLDGTKKFESRIDIALSCRGIDGGYFSNVPQKAVASSLSIDGKRLLVAIQNGTAPNTNQVICEYPLVDLQKAFNDTFDTCQQITDSKDTKAKCENHYSSPASDPKCFLFTWESKMKMPLCEKFNKDSLNKTFDNCELASSTVSANRNGWLENYNPIMGEILAKFPNGSSDVLAIMESFGSDALFVSFANGMLKRIRKNASWTSVNQPALWFANTTTSNNSLTLQTNQKTKALFYVDANKVKYVRVSCTELYPTCNFIPWDDPLRCGWCAEQNGTGYTIALSDATACATGQRISQICPPRILEVSVERGKYTIIGDDFKNLKSLNVLTCGEKCDILHQTNTVIQCVHPIRPLCDILLTGQLGESNNFTLAYFKHIGEPDDILPSEEVEPEARHSYSRTMRVIGAVLALGILLMLVTCAYHIYKRCDQKFRKYNKKMMNREKNQNPTFVDSNQMDMDHDFNFDGQLDKSRIRIVKHIGDGNSSRVFLAEYEFNTMVSKRVAVKAINNSSFEYQDIMREIELISKCSHKNIVEYIGHYRDLYGIHIVTEYMAGGDLHEFLINENNKPTIGDAFCYSLRICEGMEYLTKQHIIHRDLAARNCMLDAEHLIVKITDFGLCRTSNINYEYISENNQQKLPFRWTAIECYSNHSKFSDKSDVWSFGVVLWEIFARSLQPYGGLDSKGVRDFLLQGNRLEPIPFCPDELYQDVMMRCWDESPARRPTFSELRKEIERIFWSIETKAPEYLTTEYETPISSSNLNTVAKNSPVSTPV
uniref:receptor protein-tyrosine kinase n=1 Tax=Ditylenchus dipsaci TaxID=166011 RepID=A0A915DN09_9BILA